MILGLDATLLARIQFAFTVSFHIIFPSFTIGLASWLTYLEWRWLQTKETLYEELYRMWVKVFAVCFGMGVVSGVVMSYQFGTNWSLFSDKVGNVIGPLLGYEVLTAFFLESSFLGIMLFGWNRVSEKMHFAATCIVAAGTIISAFWILAANSWMQTPAGFSVGSDGLLYPQSWSAIIFNPSFSHRFTHMILAAFLTTACVVAGVAAFYFLHKKTFTPHAQVMYRASLSALLILAPLQLVVGHAHGLNTLKHQPLKIAAMEAHWDGGKDKPLYLFGFPNEQKERVDYGVNIPHLGSIILTGSSQGEVPGLRDAPPQDRPPVALVFWSFRVMVGLGFSMILTALIASVLFLRKELFSSALFHLWNLTMSPAGFIAVLAGWFVTEVGRQPWSAYGILRTTQSLSPVIAEQVALTLFIFVVVYTIVFGAGLYYVFKIIHLGPSKRIDPEQYYDHSIGASITKTLKKKVTHD